MNKYIPLLLGYIAFAFSGFGQAYDHIWVTGMHEFPNEPGYNNALIHFTPNAIVVQELDLKMNFESTVGVISDSAGQLLFYTNGCQIATATGDTMPGGNGLNPGIIHDWVCNKTGYVCPRGAMVLPKPGSTHEFVIFHTGARYDPVRKLTYGPFYFTEIDMALNNGKGAVTKKNQILTDGDLEPFAAVRHGNGRDWWLVIPMYASSEYRLFLFTLDGISGPYVQILGTIMDCRRIGTSVFSPDGQKFVRTQNCQALVMEFDRCAGTFSNSLLLDLPDQIVGGGGASFSPDNSRLLVSTQLQILEADLTIPKPELDSAFAWNYQWGVSLQHFQYTPYGQILINHMHRTNYLSIIENPAGESSNMGFIPKGLPLPVFSARSLPYFPNYRLYDLPNSPCDTLGINGPLSTTAKPNLADISLSLYPNPATDEVRLAFGTGAPAGMQVSLVDVAGRVLLSKPVTAGAGPFTLPLGKCRSGLYFVRVEAAGRLLAVES